MICETTGGQEDHCSNFDGGWVPSASRSACSLASKAWRASRAESSTAVIAAIPEAKTVVIYESTLEANGTIVFDSRQKKWVMYTLAFCSSWPGESSTCSKRYVGSPAWASQPSPA